MRAIAGIVLLAVACAPAAQRVSPEPGVAVPPGQRMALWQDARVDTLHGIQVGDSTMSGVPVSQPTLCDSCRVVLPLAGIDSVLELPPERSRLAPAGLAAAAMAGFVGIWVWSD